MHVHVAAAHVHGKARDDAVQRERRDGSDARTDIDGEHGIALGEGHILPEDAQKGRLGEVDAADARRLGDAVHLLARFHLIAAGDAEERLDGSPPLDHFAEEIFEKRPREAFGDDLPLIDGEADVRLLGRLAEEPFGLVPEGADLPRVLLHGDAGRFGKHDAAAEFVDLRHRSAEVDRKFYHKCNSLTYSRTRSRGSPTTFE